MFADPSLLSNVASKKGEVEGGFLAMRNLVATMSSLRLEYETAKQQTDATSIAAGSRIATAEAPAVEGGGAPTRQPQQGSKGRRGRGKGRGKGA